MVAAHDEKLQGVRRAVGFLLRIAFVEAVDLHLEVFETLFVAFV